MYDYNQVPYARNYFIKKSNSFVISVCYNLLKILTDKIRLWINRRLLLATLQKEIFGKVGHSALLNRGGGEGGELQT